LSIICGEYVIDRVLSQNSAISTECKAMENFPQESTQAEMNFHAS